MNKILKDTNYPIPIIKPYNQDGLRVEFSENKFFASLFIKGERYMTYDYLNHAQALELLSHYYLAKGHCICTGLGFAVRENWIATKKEVTKITVIEKNKNLIDYHKKIGT